MKNIKLSDLVCRYSKPLPAIARLIPLIFLSIQSSAQVVTEPCSKARSNASTVSNPLKKQLPKLLPALSSITNDQKSPESPWSGTGLYYDYLKKSLINTETCNSDESHFIACIHALSATAQYSKEGKLIRWIPDILYKNQPSSFSKILFRSDLGLLVELKPFSGRSLPDQVRILNRFEHRIKNEFAQLYRVLSSLKMRINFDQLFDQTKQIFVSTAPTLEEDLTAATWIAYLHSQFDPHTRIIPDTVYDKLSQFSHQSTGEIGLNFSSTEFGIFLKPETNSAAAQAGVLEGDRLISINGRPLIKFPALEIENNLNGPINEPVNLTIDRGGKTLHLQVNRVEKKTSDFSYHTIQVNQKRYGYLKLGFFPIGEEHAGCQAVKSALLDPELKQSAGYILDLRGNPGGGMQEATCIASLFIGPNKIVSKILSPNDLESIPLVTTHKKITNAPLVVLVDSESASASEILSGAIQEHGRGILVGRTTFGKGTFQSVQPSDEFEHIKMVRTQGRYYLASGRSPQLIGIKPDFEVYSRPNISQEAVSPLREEDSGLNVLPAEASQFQSPIEGTIFKVRECVKRNGTAEKKYEQALKENKLEDFPFLYAQDVLGCINPSGE